MKKGGKNKIPANMTGFSLISGFEKKIIRQLNKYYEQVSHCIKGKASKEYKRTVGLLYTISEINIYIYIYILRKV